MSNNTVNETKTKETELTGYQILSTKLDDREFARYFELKQIERAKELVAQILMVTSGGSNVNKGFEEYGQENLYLLMDLFMIRHKNFSVSNLAEQLQYYVHSWTKSHDESFRTWVQDVLVEQGLDEDGNDQNLIAEIEARIRDEDDDDLTADQPAEPKAVDVSPEILPQTEKPVSEKPVLPAAKNIEEHHFEIWANKLAYVLQSDKVSGEIKFALRNIFTDAANEVGVHLDDQNLIKPAFIEFMRQADFGYGKGVSNALQTIITDLQRMELEGELEQFETRFDAPKAEPASEPANQPLDLSNCAPEHLNTRISELPTMHDLSCALSGLLHNPLLPAKLYNVISDEINLLGDWETPANILMNLEQMQEGESE